MQHFTIKMDLNPERTSFMKCEYCGSKLQQGVRHCPFCGLPVSDTAVFSSEPVYETPASQTTQVKKKPNLKAPLITLAILIILNIASILFAAFAWDIAYSIREWKIGQHADTHMEQLQSYLNSRDYIGYRLYYYENSLYSCSDFEDYYAVTHACSNLYNLYDIVADFSDNREYFFVEEELATTADLLTNYVNAVFTVEQNYSYNPAYLTPDKTAAIQDVQEQMKALLVAYCGLTPEEAQQLPDFSRTKQYEIIERGLQRL